MIGRLLIAALLAAPAATPVPPLTDPNAIFAAARAAWGTSTYPRYADYDIVVRYRNGGRTVQRSWITTEDVRHEIVSSRIFAREELTNPPSPGGTYFVIPFLAGAMRPKDPEPVGQVALAVTQDFDLAPQAQRFTYKGPSDADAAASRLATIGRTQTQRRLYEVTLVETLHEGSATTYHLTLTPLVDPWRHRLRELWVDAATMKPLRAVVAGIGNRAPLTKVDWMVDFHEVEGGFFIDHEHALEPVDYGGNGHFTDFTITFAPLQLGHEPADPQSFAFGATSDPSEVQSEP